MGSEVDPEEKTCRSHGIKSPLESLFCASLELYLQPSVISTTSPEIARIAFLHPPQEVVNRGTNSSISVLSSVAARDCTTTSLLLRHLLCLHSHCA